ncbi:MAG TPA: hypothetical protein VEP89_02535 [Draconibacterium sp.]|nr:hypothetical protein [Draconibacterium sp.]
MNTREEIKTIRDKYTDMYNVGAYTNPTDYAVFLESEILALKIELNQANDTDTRTEPALPIQNVSGSACPKCGCQIYSPFGDDRLMHDVNSCGGIVAKKEGDITILP